RLRHRHPRGQGRHRRVRRTDERLRQRRHRRPRRRLLHAVRPPVADGRQPGSARQPGRRHRLRGVHRALDGPAPALRNPLRRDTAQPHPVSSEVMDDAPRLQIVGGGKMGEALLAGLLGAQWARAEELVVVEPIEARRKELAATFVDVDITDAPLQSEGAVIAVKPGDVEGACRAVADAGVQRVLSIAAGVPLAKLERWVGDGTPVVRAMPNTPALVGAGAAAIAAGTWAGDDEMAWAESILGAVGIVQRVSEPLLDAVTGLSGSGPAYLFLVAESLIEAGVLAGLPRPTAAALVTQTLLGSARLLAETGRTAEEHRATVTSPGGTTAAGLRALEARGVRSAFIEAVWEATKRSKELGSS